MTITQAQLDRRHFLQFAGVAGLTIAGLPALASCAPGATTEWTRTLDFVGWDYQPDTIKEFVSGWGTENDVTVDVTIIPSLGYSAALQSRLRGGANADVYYNFAYASQKFVEDEWAQTLSDLPQADDPRNGDRRAGGGDNGDAVRPEAGEAAGERVARGGDDERGVVRSGEGDGEAE